MAKKKTNGSLKVTKGRNKSLLGQIQFLHLKL